MMRIAQLAAIPLLVSTWAHGSVATTPYPVPDKVLTECVSTASTTYGVPELVIRAILKQEGGLVGTMSRNTNGSYDLGPMQINTINLGLISKKYPFLDWRHITYNPCINIMVGTWFLQQKIKNRNGVIWEGIGDYHSTTPSKRSVYLRSFLAHYNQLKKRYGLKPFRHPAKPATQEVIANTQPSSDLRMAQPSVSPPLMLSRDLPPRHMMDNPSLASSFAMLRRSEPK